MYSIYRDSHIVWSLTAGEPDANTEPVSLARAKTHLRDAVPDSSNTEVQAMIATARQLCEAQTNRSLVNRTYTLTLDSFPYCLTLPVGLSNVANVVISYVDTNGDTQTLGNTHYRVLSRQDGFPEIVPVYGEWFPVTRYQRDAVTITCESGTQTVPAALVNGMLLVLGYLWESRTPTMVEKQCIDWLWSPYVIHWV
jgi:uncharacterized phiE125 gp8 family phage protein